MRRFAWLAYALFAGQFLLLDLALRGARRFASEPRACFDALASVALWGLAAALARSRPARVALALGAGCLFVAELLFFRYYHVFLGERALLCAQSSWRDTRAVLRGMLPSAGLGALVLACVEHGLLRVAPALGRRRMLALGLCLPLALLGDPRAQGTPDLALLSGLPALLRARPQKTTSAPRVPPLESARERLPNVLFILSESVRASDYASAELAQAAPLARAALPERVDFRQMRSVASYTAVAVNALLSGRLPRGERAQVAATPLVFDLLRATRLGSVAPRVLYWSGQDESWLERAQPREVADSVAFSDDVLGRHVETLEEALALGIDGKLADYVAQRLAPNARPVFLLVHLAGTHAPYFVDEQRAVFRPYSHVVTWSGLPELYNAYRNALVEQDRAVAAIARTFLRVVGSEPYLVVFTSDHGEAFGDHHAIHHGQDLYEQQIHVPAWIAHGNGALGPEAAAALRAHADDFLTHLDLLPTLLDAVGVLDSFGMATLAALPGRSLLRPFSAPAAPLPVSNCTALFPCPLANYGVLAGRYELMAQPWDDDWHCVDLAAGDAELPATTPICGTLRAFALGAYQVLPNGQVLR